MIAVFHNQYQPVVKVLKLKSEPCHTRAQDRPNQRSQPSHIPCSIPSAFPLESSLATQCPSTSLQDASEQVWNGLNSLWVRWESQSCGREGWHWTWLSSDYDLFRLQPFCQKKCWNLQHRLKPSQASPVEGLPAGDDFFHSLDTEGDQPWFHLKDLESGRPHQSHTLPHWSHCILEVVFIRSCVRAWESLRCHASIDMDLKMVWRTSLATCNSVPPRSHRKSDSFQRSETCKSYA